MEVNAKYTTLVSGTDGLTLTPNPYLFFCDLTIFFCDTIQFKFKSYFEIVSSVDGQEIGEIFVNHTLE